MANLRISELDFDTIKSNLKDFLRAQDQFTDYDFEGSGFAVLLDVLAYNTHYNAYLANMLVNEMFLDSAVKRSSAVSLAKLIGYTPRSTRSARALLNLVVNNPTGSPSFITLEKNTPFSVTLDGTSFTFYNQESKTVFKENDIYSINNLEVVEGKQLTLTYVSSNPGPEEKFEIPSTTIDTSTIVVTVQDSFTNTSSRVYVLNNDITSLDNNSEVYYLEENSSEYYQIFFGDDITSKKLKVGNIVNITFLNSSGALANSSNLINQAFTTTSIGGSSSVDITTITNPTGGSNKEGIGSIRFNAPRVAAAKNRAVTAADYQAIISAEYTEAESVSVWGGEDNDPPSYGKVFIALKPYKGFFISQTTKQNIINSILANKKVLAITPEIVDPEYFYINLNISVVYNQRITTKTSDQLKVNVIDTVTRYFTSELQKFDRDFNKSYLSKLILEADQSITSVNVTVKLQQRHNIFLNSINSFLDQDAIKLQNPIVPGTLTTSRFYLITNNTETLVQLIDIPNDSPPDLDGSGVIRIINPLNAVTIVAQAGTINYGSGVVNLNNFVPTALPNTISDFRLSATIQDTSQSIKADRKQVLVLDDSVLNAFAGTQAGITVSVVAE
jgi:hypothetical protein